MFYCVSVFYCVLLCVTVFYCVLLCFIVFLSWFHVFLMRFNMFYCVLICIYYVLDVRLLKKLQNLNWNCWISRYPYAYDYIFLWLCFQVFVRFIYDEPMTNIIYDFTCSGKRGCLEREGGCVWNMLNHKYVLGNMQNHKSYLS